jgi:hypothetical protein
VSEPVLKPSNHVVDYSQAPGRHRRRHRQVLLLPACAIDSPAQETPCRRDGGGGGGARRGQQGLGPEPGCRGSGIAVGRRGEGQARRRARPPFRHRRTLPGHVSCFVSKFGPAVRFSSHENYCRLIIGWKSRPRSIRIGSRASLYRIHSPFLYFFSMLLDATDCPDYCGSCQISIVPNCLLRLLVRKMVLDSNFSWIIALSHTHAHTKSDR